jgi:hypothetical protein
MKISYKYMKETITIPREEYEHLLEEVGILHNDELMVQIKESEEALKKGVKPQRIHL